ncbi:MAG: tetratricopeptide repeat protein [Bacteroidia bacterium]|jgi:serine phosphatase RsbU (regulator of sigma subunit)|nr:tetratricopeptide repeat protein [Bacteroidia bacterium]
MISPKIIFRLLFFTFILSSGRLCAQPGKAAAILSEIKTKGADSARLFDLNEASIQFVRNSDYDSAIRYTQIVIDYAAGGNFPRQLASAHNILANCYYFRGLYPESVKSYLVALKIYEKLSDSTRIANCYNNIGNTYTRQKYYDQALSYHRKALDIRKRLGDKENLANSYNNIANIYHSQKKYNLALDNHTQSLRLKIAGQDTAMMVLSLNNIGGVYTDMQLYDSAIAYHELALKLNELAEKSEEDEEIAYVNLSRTYMLLKEYKKAEEYGLKAHQMATQIGDAETLLEVNDILSKIYQQTGRYELALNYYQKYVWFRDSLYNEENTAKLLAEEYQYKYEKKLEEEKLEQARKDAVTETEKKKKNQILILVCSLLALVIGFAVFIYRSYLKKREVSEKILEQNTVIREKQKEIIDSINYAKRIQNAVLPDADDFRNEFADAFVYNNPKDIVSGDLYWYAKLSTTSANPIQLIVVALADCTGHGVPGGFMSLLATQLLNHSVKNPDINSPGELLYYMNTRISQDLNKSTKERINDGMDIAVCAIDFARNTVYFSGANRPLWIMRGNVIEETDPTRASIGAYTAENQEFLTHTLQLAKGDRIYLFSDGITDQFGGAENKKFTKKRLKEFLLDTAEMSLTAQCEKFSRLMNEWQGSMEQTDDMMMIGIKL